MRLQQEIRATENYPELEGKRSGDAGSIGENEITALRTRGLAASSIGA